MSVLHRETRRRAAPPQCPVRPAQPPFARRAIACCALPAEEWAVSHARHFTTVRLANWQISEEVADAAKLVVTEFVTNTVRHSGSTEVGLRLARSGSSVWIEVFDSGLWRAPAASDPDDDIAESGRGFHLVDAVTQRCGVHCTPSGTCAWAMLPESPPSGRQETPTTSLSARAGRTRACGQAPSHGAPGPNGHGRPTQRRDDTARAY
ncbi:ATP-binding protein [Streptomyces sp. NPDC005322]|uniref:ATP-binding protein n=1 Tax=unclassified Streptomyces TaxID=2593676 RepID=UPI0033A055A7